MGGMLADGSCLWCGMSVLQIRKLQAAPGYAAVQQARADAEAAQDDPELAGSSCQAAGELRGAGGAHRPPSASARWAAAAGAGERTARSRSSIQSLASARQRHEELQHWEDAEDADEPLPSLGGEGPAYASACWVRGASPGSSPREVQPQECVPDFEGALQPGRSSRPVSCRCVCVAHDAARG